MSAKTNKRNSVPNGRQQNSARNHAGGERGNPQKLKHSHKLVIPLDCVGLIIGRSGANIKVVENRYHVRVNVDRTSGVATVSGNSDTEIKEACNHIKNQLDSRGCDNNRVARSEDGEGDNYHCSGGDNEKLRMDSSNNLSTEKPSDTASFTGIIDWDAVNRRAAEYKAKRWAKYPALTKNVYVENQEVSNLSPKEVSRLRKENNEITVSRAFEQVDDPDIPNPVWKFEQCFGDYPDLLQEIQKQKFKKPSPIQSQAWPILLKGEDMIGIAQTGTGKTLAFLLPAMIHTEYQSIPRSLRGGPNVLVLAPTRELALQIEKEVNKYSFRGMKAACIYGGGDRSEQIRRVQEGVEIIICTPGRLNDLIEAKVINVSSVTYLVLDEADRMLDMGFEPQILKILLDIRPDRQIVMTSATWPPGVRRLAQRYMSNPIQVCVGSLDLAATHTVKQIVMVMDESEKYSAIKEFINNMGPKDKAIVFCGTKVCADDVCSDLSLEGVSCASIHGSRDQADREQAIDDITTGYIKLLIATDVASRGLDIDDITHVVNYDFPRNIEEYVHRVGRTGRAGRTGTSISFITPNESGVAKELISILEEAGQEVPSELRYMACCSKTTKSRRGNNRGGNGGRGYRN